MGMPALNAPAEATEIAPDPLARDIFFKQQGDDRNEVGAAQSISSPGPLPNAAPRCSGRSMVYFADL